MAITVHSELHFFKIIQEFVVCFFVCFFFFCARAIAIKYLYVVEGNPKAPFSIASTSRCRGGQYSFPWIVPLTLDPYFIMLRVIKYVFETLVWLHLGLRPGLLDHWQTLLCNVPDIGQAVRVFANGPGDLGSIPVRVIPKTQKNGTWCLLA